MEESFNIPKTSETVRYIERAGVYLLQPASVSKYTKKDGSEGLDKNGNPGMVITFKDPKGAMISATYYYSKYPYGDPRREDPNLRCASEFWLTNLKAVLGFKASDEVPMDKFLKGKFWGRVVEHRYTKKNSDEVVMTQWKLNQSKYDVYNPTTETKGRPFIEGEPGEDGKPSGEFLKYEEDFRRASQMGEVAKPAGPKPRTEESEAHNESSDNEAAYDGKIEDEPPDF